MVRMYVCVCVYLCVFINVCVYPSLRLFMYMCVSASVCLFLSVFVSGLYLDNESGPKDVIVVLGLPEAVL